MVLRAALQRRLDIVVSVPLVVEYEAVLTRPAHLQVFGLTEEEVRRLIDALVAVADTVRLAYLWRPALRDPDDDMVLETAVNGGAAAIITHNLRDFGDIDRRFGIGVLAPSSLLPFLGER